MRYKKQKNIYKYPLPTIMFYLYFFGFVVILMIAYATKNYDTKIAAAKEKWEKELKTADEKLVKMKAIVDKNEKEKLVQMYIEVDKNLKKFKAEIEKLDQMIKAEKTLKDETEKRLKAVEEKRNKIIKDIDNFEKKLKDIGVKSEWLLTIANDENADQTVKDIVEKYEKLINATAKEKIEKENKEGAA